MSTPVSNEPRSFLLRLARENGGARWGSNPSEFDMDSTRRLHRKLSRVFGYERSYFRLKVAGWEHVPDTQVLCVSNHSGGTTMLDAWGIWYAWHDHFQFQRPGHGLGHEMLFALDRTGRLLSRMGAVRASRENGQRVLQEWKRDLFVMPGGDRDTWRSWRDRYTVNFAGRTGYARLAIKAGVPIVPVANTGAQSTMLVLNDGAAIARAMHLPQLARAEIWPIHISFPWGLTAGPWPHLPPPTRLQYRFGAPIAPPVTCAPGEEPPADAIAYFDQQVQASIQDMLDDFRENSRSEKLIRWMESRLQKTRAA